MSTESDRDDSLVIYSSDDHSASSAWTEALNACKNAHRISSTTDQNRGSDTGIVFESHEFVDGLGFWAAYDENTMYGGMMMTN